MEDKEELVLIGEMRAGSGNVLLVNVLGNHLPKDNAKYNPCLEMIFDDEKEQWNHYCKAYRITVNSNRLTDSIHTGFKKVNYKDCKLEELTESEVKELVKNY